MSDPDVEVTMRPLVRTLSLTEGTVRYHLRRIAKNVPDGYAQHRRLAATDNVGTGGNATGTSNSTALATS